MVDLSTNTIIPCCMLILKYPEIICYIKDAGSEAHININPTSWCSEALVTQPGPHNCLWEGYITSALQEDLRINSKIL